MPGASFIDIGDTDADLFSVVQDGVRGTRMQGFGGILADADIWRLIAMFRTDSPCDEADHPTPDPP